MGTHDLSFLAHRSFLNEKIDILWYGGMGTIKAYSFYRRIKHNCTHYKNKRIHVFS